MKSRVFRRALWVVFIALSLSAIAFCDGADSAGKTPILGSSIPSLKMGMELYFGATDMPGQRYISDGMWAGQGTFYPSITYLEWGQLGRTARVSLGTGDLYTNSESTLDQPVEAYVTTPLGKGTVTVGKYYVPFAQQEWLYEAKLGVKAEWGGDRTSLTASANYNEDSRKSFIYLRGAYKVAEDAEVGLSVASGEGFCSESVHDLGYSLDTTIGYGGCRFSGEWNHFYANEPGLDFNYVSGKLYYEKLGDWQPFLGVFSWNDRSDTFGSFRSTVYGVSYQASSSLAIEGALARTSEGSVTWLQFHWNWEKDFPMRW